MFILRVFAQGLMAKRPRNDRQTPYPIFAVVPQDFWVHPVPAPVQGVDIRSENVAPSSLHRPAIGSKRDQTVYMAGQLISLEIPPELIGIYVSPPWIVDITELAKPGENRIEILVNKTLANHYLTIRAAGPVWIERQWLVTLSQDEAR